METGVLESLNYEYLAGGVARAVINWVLLDEEKVNKITGGDLETPIVTQVSTDHFHYIIHSFYQNDTNHWIGDHEIYRYETEKEMIKQLIKR